MHAQTHKQMHMHSLTYTCSHVWNFQISLPVVELLPLPVKAGSLSSWTLWPHNNDSWLSEWRCLPPRELWTNTEEQDVSQQPLCVTKTGGEEEEEEVQCCILLPELLQKYRKRTHDTSAFWEPHGPFPDFFVCGCVCVFGQRKAWQMQKYRWQLGEYVCGCNKLTVPF